MFVQIEVLAKFCHECMCSVYLKMTTWLLKLSLNSKAIVVNVKFWIFDWNAHSILVNKIQCKNDANIKTVPLHLYWKNWKKTKKTFNDVETMLTSTKREIACLNIFTKLWIWQFLFQSYFPLPATKRNKESKTH